VKGALDQYTRLAAQDLAPRIRVNAVAVGSTATSALDIVLTNDELRTAMEESTPLRRIGDPQEIAAAIVFLASPAGSYITGRILEVDGGLQTANLDFEPASGVILAGRVEWPAGEASHSSGELL
jgi:7-alpha-hydroxysteroid dehydrogenase